MHEDALCYCQRCPVKIAVLIYTWGAYVVAEVAIDYKLGGEVIVDIVVVV